MAKNTATTGGAVGENVHQEIHSNSNLQSDNENDHHEIHSNSILQSDNDSTEMNVSSDIILNDMNMYKKNYLSILFYIY